MRLKRHQTELGFTILTLCDYVYCTTFNLATPIASITGRYAADDSLIEIALNGMPVVTGPGSGFCSWTSFLVDTGFVTGHNTLGFKVNNGAPRRPNGLRVESPSM